METTDTGADTSRPGSFPVGTEVRLSRGKGNYILDKEPELLPGLGYYQYGTLTNSRVGRYLKLGTFERV